MARLLRWVIVATVHPFSHVLFKNVGQIENTLQTMVKKHCQIPNPPPPPPLRQIRCTVAQISPLPLSKPSCDWWPTSSLIVAAYRAWRGAAGVVHGGRQPWDNSCTGGRKSQQSEQEKFTQGEARWGLPFPNEMTLLLFCLWSLLSFLHGHLT